MATPTRNTAAGGAAAGAGDTGSSSSTYTPYFREYTLLIEYKHLQTKAPSGLYVVPAFDTVFVWHGVVFIRQGFYRQGVFKFRLEIPDSYPESRPQVVFTSRMFHPLVDSQGRLFLDNEFPAWTPHKDNIAKVLAYVKRIFYDIDVSTPVNKEAVELFKYRDEYLARCQSIVSQSFHEVYSTAADSTLRFSQQEPAHDRLRSDVVNQRVTSREDLLSFFADEYAQEMR